MENGIEWIRENKSRTSSHRDGLPPKQCPHLIILNKSGSLILTVRATFQDT